VQKKIPLRSADKEIQIDGVVDPDWHRADSTADFFQLQPYYAQPPTQRTVGRVLTTPEALYCLLVCYDDQNGVQ